MKKNIPLFGKLTVAGLVLAFLFSGCWNGLSDINTIGGGNVTITVDTENAARTLFPNEISTSAFDRIQLDFTHSTTKAQQQLVLGKNETSKSTRLEAGTWTISAKGFITLNDTEYEAASGSASVAVNATQNSNVNITLRTGIFEGKPGLLTYNTGYPADVTRATLEAIPLNNAATAGKTANLIQAKAGVLELLPGYYLLTLRAETSTTLALWNDLVHIYSGLNTLAGHEFTEADFKTTITLSGSVRTGELQGSKVTSVTVHAYGDANYVNRIAGAEIPSLDASGGGTWSMTVPGSLAGGKVYFRLDETITDSKGETKTFIRNTNPYGDDIPSGTAGINNLDLAGSFTWSVGTVTPEGNIFAANITAPATVTAGTATAATTTTDESFTVLAYRYPADINYKYVFDFKASTDSEDGNLMVLYIFKHPYTNVINDKTDQQMRTITSTPEDFIVLSSVAIDRFTRPEVYFICASNQEENFSITLNNIQTTWDYVPPPPPGVESRFTATPEADGVRLSVNFTDLPRIFTGAQFINVTTGGGFNAYWGDASYPAVYEIIYPYVDQNKTYTFRMDWQGGDTSMASLIIADVSTATVTNGRGELKYTNAAELALVMDGTTLKLNTAPVLSNYDKKNAEDPQYYYEIMSGASWETDPTTKWIVGLGYDDPTEVFLMNPQGSWMQLAEYLSAVAGKTCFANFSYQFDYNNDDLYPLGTTLKGKFFANQISSTPFIHPHVVPGAFTAEAHPEGVKLIVDLTKAPQGIGNVQFYAGDAENFSNWRPMAWLGMDTEHDWYYNEADDTWYEDPDRSHPIQKWNGKDTVEIIYPFVENGKEYSFGVEYGGSAIKGEATVTAGGGLGDLTAITYNTVGLYYDARTKTVRANGTPALSALNTSSPYYIHVDLNRTGYYWQFVKGHDWDDQGDMRVYPDVWSGTRPSATPLTAVTLDNTFDVVLGRNFSNSPTFINNQYRISYRGIDFDITVSPLSGWFTFPNFDPAVGNGIYTAFDTNSDLWVWRQEYISQGSVLLTNVGSNGGDSFDPIDWYIDGTLYTSNYHNDGQDEWYELAGTDTLAPGIHYGLVVVKINGVPFAQEFSFRVQN